ncbi:barstar family protein [uncultured Brachyspira sp.]|uniref:barstar family protein n=1 Tax=uncultured Brachyspira sp. TaxID=221953 RepID=UPI00261893D6|nr:barstar family protein [uncultured Brachyspira sp.]
MTENRYKNIIFIDTQINEFTKNIDTNKKTLFVEFDGRLLDEECNISCEFNLKLNIPFLAKTFDGFEGCFNSSKITDKEGVTYDKIYIYIYKIYRILPDITDNYFRTVFFNMISNVRNNELIFIIDSYNKDYFLLQINLYKKYKKDIESTAEVYKQVLFIDDSYKRMTTNNVFFAEVEGKNCIDPENFFTEIATKCKFPSYFGRNLDALDDCIDDFGWLGNPYEIFMIYIKDIKSILPDDKYEKCVFFDIINNLTNKRVFILIDKNDKDYFLDCINKMEEFQRINP